MRCNCGNWDDASPCKIHGEQKPRSEICWHTVYVVTIGRRLVNLKWFYTIAKDAIRTFESEDFDSKIEVTNQLERGINLNPKPKP